MSTIETDQLFADSNGLIWRIDDLEVAKEIFGRKKNCVEASRLDTGKRK